MLATLERWRDLTRAESEITHRKQMAFISVARYSVGSRLLEEVSVARNPVILGMFLALISARRRPSGQYKTRTQRAMSEEGFKYVRRVVYMLNTNAMREEN